MVNVYLYVFDYLLCTTLWIPVWIRIWIWSLYLHYGSRWLAKSWVSWSIYISSMMTSSHGNIFRVIGPLLVESIGHRWIPLTKANDAELWCFLWSRLNMLSKQSRHRWFVTPWRQLCRHCWQWGMQSPVSFQFLEHWYKMHASFHEIIGSYKIKPEKMSSCTFVCAHVRLITMAWCHSHATGRKTLGE